MRMSIMLTVLTCVFGLTGLSHAAQTLASPAIFGSLNQTTAQCIIGNSGPTLASVDVRIVDEAGNVVNRGCGRVEPNFICEVAAPANFASAYACSATTPGSVTKLRGALVLRDANGELLRSAELQ
jgi:hypothetical protein